jgi:hypothetical protein
MGFVGREPFAGDLLRGLQIVTSSDAAVPRANIRCDHLPIQLRAGWLRRERYLPAAKIESAAVGCSLRR